MYSIALGNVGEKGGGSAFGHACGVRVDGAAPRGLWPPVGGGLCSLALRGQRPFGPRGVVAADAADLKKGGRGWRRGLCRRVVKGKVDGPPSRRLWPPVGGGLCSLRSGGDSPDGLRVVVAASPQIVKVSATRFTFGVIWQNKHYDDQPPPVASPPLVPYGTTFPRSGKGCTR